MSRTISSLEKPAIPGTGRIPRAAPAVEKPQPSPQAVPLAASAAMAAVPFACPPIFLVSSDLNPPPAAFLPPDIFHPASAHFPWLAFPGQLPPTSPNAVSSFHHSPAPLPPYHSPP